MVVRRTAKGLWSRTVTRPRPSRPDGLTGPRARSERTGAVIAGNRARQVNAWLRARSPGGRLMGMRRGWGFVYVEPNRGTLGLSLRVPRIARTPATRLMGDGGPWIGRLLGRVPLTRGPSNRRAAARTPGPRRGRHSPGFARSRRYSCRLAPRRGSASRSQRTALTEPGSTVEMGGVSGS
jgi:hypothetical protein